MATLLEMVENTLREDAQINAAGGLSDADMLVRMPASQRAGFLESIGALQAKPPRNSLDRSSAPDAAERKRRTEGAAKAVKALKALSLLGGQQKKAASSKRPKGSGERTAEHAYESG